MKKNYLKKNLLTVVMLLAVSSTMVSCQGLIDAMFGTEDTPSSSQQTVPSGAIVKTESGATITASTPAEITELLGQIKSDIATKSASEYEIKIANTTVEATSSDNIISVPKVVGSNVNLVFQNAVQSSTPLIVKAAETASAESTIAVNNLTITTPNVDESNAIDLTLNMPETTVALKTSGTQTVYEEVVATTAINTLYIYPGVWIKRLRVNGGTVVVKEGGTIETYVYPAGKIGANGEAVIYASYNTDQESCGIEPIIVNYLNRERYEISVNDDGSKPYFTKNLKVVKGTDEYAHVCFRNDIPTDEDGITIDIGDNYPIKTLTVGDGAAVLLGSWPQIKNIVGEGNRTAIVASDVYLDKPDDPESDSENYLYLDYVQKISNVIIDTYRPKGFIPSIAKVNNVPLQIDNCSFGNFSSIRLRGLKDGDDYAQNCDFSNLRSSAHFRIQLEGEDFKKVLFESCEFNKDQYFFLVINHSRIKLDESGNRVYDDYYYNWWSTDMSVTESSAQKEDIPAERLAVGQTDEQYVNDEPSQGYWVTKSLAYDDYDISNKTLTVEFKDCVTPNPIRFYRTRNDFIDVGIIDNTYFLVNGQSFKPVVKNVEIDGYYELFFELEKQ